MVENEKKSKPNDSSFVSEMIRSKNYVIMLVKTELLVRFIDSEDPNRAEILAQENKRLENGDMPGDEVQKLALETISVLIDIKAKNKEENEKLKKEAQERINRFYPLEVRS